MKSNSKSSYMNTVLLYLIIITSILSYEITLYRKIYPLMTVMVFGLGTVLFLANFSMNTIAKQFKMNVSRNISILVYGFLIVLSSLVSSLKYGKFSYFDLISIIITICTLYIFYLFIPIIISIDVISFIKKLAIIITVLSVFSIIIVINGTFLWYKPTHYNRIASILFDPNYFATLAAIGVILSINNGGKYKLIALINFIALFYSGSRAAMISLIIVLILFYFYKKKITFNSVVGLMILLILLYYSASWLLATGYFRIHQGLNSRDYLWELSYTLIRKEPLWGYGYGSVGDLLVSMGAVNRSSHNSYIDMVLIYGVLAFLVYIFILIKGVFIGFIRRVPEEITKSILFLLFSANSISINLGGLGGVSLLLTIFLGLSNMKSQENCTTRDKRIVRKSDEKDYFS